MEDLYSGIGDAKISQSTPSLEAGHYLLLLEQIIQKDGTGFRGAIGWILRFRVIHKFSNEGQVVGSLGADFIFKNAKSPELHKGLFKKFLMVAWNVTEAEVDESLARMSAELLPGAIIDTMVIPSRVNPEYANPDYRRRIYYAELDRVMPLELISQQFSQKDLEQRIKHESIERGEKGSS